MDVFTRRFETALAIIKASHQLPKVPSEQPHGWARAAAFRQRHENDPFRTAPAEELICLLFSLRFDTLNPFRAQGLP